MTRVFYIIIIQSVGSPVAAAAPAIRRRQPPRVDIDDRVGARAGGLPDPQTVTEKQMVVNLVSPQPGSSSRTVAGI